MVYGSVHINMCKNCWNLLREGMATKKTCIHCTMQTRKGWWLCNPIPTLFFNCSISESTLKEHKHSKITCHVRYTISRTDSCLLSMLLYGVRTECWRVVLTKQKTVSCSMKPGNYPSIKKVILRICTFLSCGFTLRKLPSLGNAFISSPMPGGL